MAKITVENTEISVITYNNRDYICLTDMANAKENESRASDIIKNWLRNRYTIEFLGTWEMIHNPNFKVVEFDHFKMQAGLPAFVYADEADMFNEAMFGMTAKQWREANPELKGNIRDYATINQLICLSNMENLNDGLPQNERLEKPNKIAIQQMQVLENVDDRRLLK